ncbi:MULTISPECIES: hypothetical protein [unclassified Pseudomonas]|uniref:hypothetical protein n=1 Tax=unclassified Pseudomonas TaxID=196821 RepID=UPI0011A9BDFE|nr:MULTISPECIES: hypothetical protein [unclassified Pseudomonas]TWC19863.1 hypothetical protein FBY00_105232 [Pseudomonas sp. SJZ075]TWC35237.1 hypothetical protein FBY02_1055 [Pseudomonas sp. SJZ078]TWC56183.1 hypothetical protein FBY11_1055 [Pseudomonas sp. SJZ124]TWC91865.1 hypothetical protein FBY09_105232 [Pseudomonas sp. SJZ101]
MTGNTAGKVVPFTVPFRYVTENLNGTVDVSYSVTRGTTLLGNSIVRHLTVGSALELTAPSVKEANGATLNPVNARDTLTVVVPTNAALLPDDKLKVTWTGAPGTPAEGSYTSDEWPVRDGWEVPIDNRVVAFSLGKAVTVTYTVIQAGVESPPSDTFTLNVQAMPVASLAMPLILEAAQGGIGNELDLGSFTGDARVTAAPWPLIAAGQRVWLRCEGTASDGSDQTITLATGTEVDSSEVTAGLSRSIPRAELEKLLDGSELKVVLEVTFNRSTSESEAVVFPLRIYALANQAPFEHYTPFTNGDMNGWLSGGIVAIRQEAGNYYCRLGSAATQLSTIQRNIEGLRPGARYEFSLLARRGAGHEGLLKFRVAGHLHEPSGLTSIWRPFSITFEPTHETVQIEIFNGKQQAENQVTEVDDIRIRSL